MRQFLLPCNWEACRLRRGGRFRLHMEDVAAPRLQLNIVSCTAPLIRLVGEQVVNAEDLARLNAEFGEMQIDPSGLGVPVMQIYDHQNYIFLRRVRLAVADQEWLVGRMKAKATIAVQR